MLCTISAVQLLCKNLYDYSSILEERGFWTDWMNECMLQVRGFLYLFPLEACVVFTAVVFGFAQNPSLMSLLHANPGTVSKCTVAPFSCKFSCKLGAIVGHGCEDPSLGCTRPLAARSGKTSFCSLRAVCRCQYSTTERCPPSPTPAFCLLPASIGVSRFQDRTAGAAAPG